MQIKKVDELEWYLSFKAFEKNMVRNYCEEDPITIQKFHNIWNSLKQPQFQEDSLIVYSPFDVHLILHPYTSILIPLGFCLPKDLLWNQMYNNTLLFSDGRMNGTAGAIGSVLKITNISDHVYQLNLKRNDPLASGILLNSCNPCYEYKRILLKETQASADQIDFSFYVPGVFDDTSICAMIDFLPSSFYLSISKKEDIRFMIHKSISLYNHPESDPILDVIRVDDVYKYQLSKPGISNEYILRRRELYFDEKYKEIAGNMPIEGMRYIIPVHCAIDVAI